MESRFWPESVVVAAWLVFACLPTLTSCSGHDGCRFVVLLSGDRNCAQDSCPRVRSTCELVWLGSPQAAMPVWVDQADANESEDSAARFAAALEQYYAGDPNAALAVLEAEFGRIRTHPEWLPTSSGKREVVYQALAVLLRHRVEAGDGKGGEVVAEWLALHMSDIEPSVRWMPPEVEYVAARARDQARDGWGRVTVAAVEGCAGPATAYVDGGRSGPVPAEVLLPPGRHALAIECDGYWSWIRWVTPSDRRTITFVRPDLESRMQIGTADVRLGSDLTRDDRFRVLRHSMRWLAAEGGLVLDPVDLRNSLFVVGAKERPPEVRTGDAGLELRLHEFRALSEPELLAIAGFTTSALSLAAAVLANLEYNGLQAETSSGIVDRRSDAGVWFVTSIALYAVSAVSGAAGLGCLIWGVVEGEESVSPLF